MIPASAIGITLLLFLLPSTTNIVIVSALISLVRGCGGDVHGALKFLNPV